MTMCEGEGHMITNISDWPNKARREREAKEQSNQSSTSQHTTDTNKMHEQA